MDKGKKQVSYSHILKYTGIFGSVQGFGILISIIRGKLVAVILGPQGMGLTALFNSTIKLVGDSTNLGIATSAVREIAEAYETDNQQRLDETIRLIRAWSLLTAMLGMLVCIVLSPLLNKWTFEWGDHTLHFVLLSPIVALMAITGGETAILKGTRRLKQLALVSVYNMVAALFTSVPIYYIWGEKGIIPALTIMAFTQMALTIAYSYKSFPLRRGKKGTFWESQFSKEGLRMVKLGIAFVGAGILGSGADFLIRSFLNTSGSLDVVGLYNAGYMMTVTYAGMIFTAMETDYFPRLSGITGTGPELSQTVNQQIEVSLLLVAPMLVAFQIALPILLPALYSGKFMPVLGMVQVTVLAMYMRAIKLPIAYLPLAKGDSLSYLLMEGVYDVAIVAMVIWGYHAYGLTGTGLAVTLVSIFDFVMLTCYMGYRYHYRLSLPVVRYIALQLPIGLAAYALTHSTSTWVYYGCGIALFLLSTLISFLILRKKTHLLQMGGNTNPSIP